MIVAALLASSSVQARPVMLGQPVQVPANAAAQDPAFAPSPSPATRTPGDPHEKLNRSLFGVQQKFDRAVFRPVARGYATIIPKFIRTGLRHLLRHIREPIVFLNDVLQLKPKRAVRTLARFAINTTAGVGGLFDVAKTAKLPHRNNGLGNTLARYGVGPGPYLFLPLVGPTQLRDLFGGGVDGLIYPVAIGSPFNRTDYQVSTAAIGGLDLRAESDAGFKALLDGAADPYATLRSVYLQNRAAEIADIKGEAPAPGGLDDPLVDPEATSEPATDAPSPEVPAAEPTPTEPTVEPSSSATVDTVSGELQMVAFF